MEKISPGLFYDIPANLRARFIFSSACFRKFLPMFFRHWNDELYQPGFCSHKPPVKLPTIS